MTVRVELIPVRVELMTVRVELMNRGNSDGIRTAGATPIKLCRPVGTAEGYMCRKFRGDISIRSRDMVPRRNLCGLTSNLCGLN